MKKFYFNNSSLSDLACSQRYVYRVVRGAIVPSTNDALIKGTFFHQIMRVIDSDAHTAMMLSLFNKPADWETVGQDYLNKSALLAEKIFLENKPIFNDCVREQWIEHELPPTEIDGESVISIIGGTLDLISFLPEENFVLITDYKTTSKPLNGQHVSSYNLKSQQFFYPWLLLLNHSFLPERFQAAIKAGRVGFSYIHCSPLTNKYIRMPHRVIDLKILDQYIQQFLEKSALAAYLHVHPDSAVKDGSIHDLCFKCPFPAICELHSPENEKKHFELWPYKHKPYNPKEKDE